MQGLQLRETHVASLRDETPPSRQLACPRRAGDLPCPCAQESEDAGVTSWSLSTNHGPGVVGFRSGPGCVTIPVLLRYMVWEKERDCSENQG